MRYVVRPPSGNDEWWGIADLREKQVDTMDYVVVQMRQDVRCVEQIIREVCRELNADAAASAEKDHDLKEA